MKHIFECGQCFRWNYDNKEEKYIGVVDGHVISVKEEIKPTNILSVKEQQRVKDYIFKSTMKTDQELADFVKNYFNLKLNYDDIKKELSQKNSISILNLEDKEDKRVLQHNIALKEAMDYGYGIRILKQNLWETVITYIISANNNIPRIKKIIETLSCKYGKSVVFEEKEYYSFPTPKELSVASMEDLRECGLGYRDKSIFNITKDFLEKENLDLDFKGNVIDLKNNLMQYSGIGPKVADCILLFALNKYEVFPIDVWVRRVMNDVYFNKENEKKVTNEEIINFVKAHYDLYAGIAQQYLFYWKRETNGKK